MQLKINSLKFTTNTRSLLCMASFMFFGLTTSFAQEIIEDEEEKEEEVAEVEETPQEFQRVKIDGVAAVIGEHVILDSDIAIAYQQLLSEGVSKKDVSRSELAGSLFENKLYAHHAVQDSILVADGEVNAMVDQQIGYMTQQLGTIDKVLSFYKKSSVEDFKKELFEILNFFHSLQLIILKSIAIALVLYH